MSYRPVEPTRHTIQALTDAGLSIDAIAAAAGITQATVINITAGHSVYVQDWTADALARLTVTQVLPYETTGYPAVGTRRRIQALLAIGWTHTLLADASGIATKDLLDEQKRRVDASTHAATCELYDRLSMRPGPSTLNRRRAARFGWVPPLAWDDDAIDDPTATPFVDEPAQPEPQARGAAYRQLQAGVDPIAVQRAINGQAPGRLTRAERVEAIRVLARLGHPDPEIARRTRSSTRTVLRLRADNGIPSQVEPSTGLVRPRTTHPTEKGTAA